MCEQMIGLIGVVIGSLITGVPTWLLARANRRDKYKLAIYGKRIEKHQEAYTLMSELRKSLRDEVQKLKTIETCDKWWDNNCLYLEQGAREAFGSAYMIAMIPREETDVELKEEIYRTINTSIEKIVKGIDLQYLPKSDRKPSKEE